mmetsp:Transcript_13359/g.25942  ORF Transcript_13359/g.25942 Transcript_13359/m.25942 type:complete len:226 (-) Transcript_13359:597-1274(-)
MFTFLHLLKIAIGHNLRLVSMLVNTFVRFCRCPVEIFPASVLRVSTTLVAGVSPTGHAGAPIHSVHDPITVGAHFAVLLLPLLISCEVFENSFRFCHFCLDLLGRLLLESEVLGPAFFYPVHPLCSCWPQFRARQPVVVLAKAHGTVLETAIFTRTDTPCSDLKIRYFEHLRTIRPWASQIAVVPCNMPFDSELAMFAEQGAFSQQSRNQIVSYRVFAFPTGALG